MPPTLGTPYTCINRPRSVFFADGRYRGPQFLVEHARDWGHDQVRYLDQFMQLTGIVLLLRINLLSPPVFPSSVRNGISKIPKIIILLFLSLLISILFIYNKNLNNFIKSILIKFEFFLI